MSSPAHLAAQTYYAPPDHLSILSPVRIPSCPCFHSNFNFRKWEWGGGCAVFRKFQEHIWCEKGGTVFGHCYVLMTITNYLLVNFVYSFNLLIFRRCKYKQWNGYDYESSDTWVMCFFIPAWITKGNGT